MTHALVLAGGGVTGVAWETGVLLGLRDAGHDIIGNLDLVVGTSAGSTVGAQILSGTMFKTTSSTVANPYSGTSTGDGGGAMNQSLKNTTPTQKKS